MGVVYRLAPCVLSPPPALTVSSCASPNTPGLPASVSGGSGDRFTWAVFGGTINEGQGTSSITFTSGPPGTRMSVQVFEDGLAGVRRRDVRCGAGGLHGCARGRSVPPLRLRHRPGCHHRGLRQRGLLPGQPGLSGSDGRVPAQDRARIVLASSAVRRHLRRRSVSGGPDFPYSDWIEQLATEEITGGCFTDPIRFCPERTVTRAEMAVLLLKTEHGSAYVPPLASASFRTFLARRASDSPIGSRSCLPRA